MSTHSEARDILAEGLALMEQKGQIDRKLHLFLGALQIGLTELEEAIARSFLVNLYARKGDLERARQELLSVRQIIGKLADFDAQEMDALVKAYSPYLYNPPDREEWYYALLDDMAKSKPAHSKMMSEVFTLSIRDKIDDDILDEWRDFPSNADNLHLLLGYLYLESKQTEKGIAEYNRVIKEHSSDYDPQNAPGNCVYFRTILGQMFQEKGDMKRAVKEWRKVMEVRDTIDTEEESYVEGSVWLYQSGNIWLSTAEQLLRLNEPLTK